MTERRPAVKDDSGRLGNLDREAELRRLTGSSSYGKRVIKRMRAKLARGLPRPIPDDLPPRARDVASGGFSISSIFGALKINEVIEQQIENICTSLTRAAWQRFDADPFGRRGQPFSRSAQTFWIIAEEIQLAVPSIVRRCPWVTRADIVRVLMKGWPAARGSRAYASRAALIAEAYDTLV